MYIRLIVNKHKHHPAFSRGNNDIFIAGCVPFFIGTPRRVQANVYILQLLSTWCAMCSLLLVACPPRVHQRIFRRDTDPIRPLLSSLTALGPISTCPARVQQRTQASFVTVCLTATSILGSSVFASYLRPRTSTANINTIYHHDPTISL